MTIWTAFFATVALILLLHIWLRHPRCRECGAKAMPNMSTALVKECHRADKAEAEAERERMRLAACGVAALGYFDGCKPEYDSASLQDVIRLWNKAHPDMPQPRKPVT